MHTIAPGWPGLEHEAPELDAVYQSCGSDIGLHRCRIHAAVCYSSSAPVIMLPTPPRGGGN